LKEQNYEIIRNIARSNSPMLYVSPIWHNSINSLVYSRLGSNMNHSLQWQKFPVLDDGYICLVDHMGDDYAIVQAARKSYDKDLKEAGLWQGATDRSTLRFMMRLGHTSPFEMVEIKFLVRVPMDCWRQWIRHRTANVNEYSTRYTEAIDSQQTTAPDEWRLQATDNKQGSSGSLEEWPEGTKIEKDYIADEEGLPTECNIVKIPNYRPIITQYPKESPGEYLQLREAQFHRDATELYQERLALGVAKEQARKDLPLSTYTEAYWKCDLHNIFNFLRLRMDSHAQLEIRTYANAMYEIVKQLCPVACEAFEDYVLHAKKFSRMEMEVLRNIVSDYISDREGTNNYKLISNGPASMTDREWKEFLTKLT